MLYAIGAICIGLAAIFFAKKVLPKFQEKMEQQATEQKAKREAKKKSKEEQS